MNRNPVAVIVLCGLCILACVDVRAQQIPVRKPTGGGEVLPTISQCITPHIEQRIVAENAASIQRLQAQGKIPLNNVLAQVSFTWPLRSSPSYSNPSYYAIYNYVDLDTTFPGHIRDYNCGNRSYDQTSGYNHAGTDIVLWPFPWQMMDNNTVEIIAAADGVIIGKVDGNDDRSCQWDPNITDWNAVFVRHADGSQTWYGHMKQGSLTKKNVGDAVQQGEVLGLVGSAGFSSAPHLHFEVHDQNNRVIDPWFGPCNYTTASSWWAQQKPYREPTLNAVMTEDSVPVFAQCPSTRDHIYAKDIFKPGDPVYYAAYFHDQEIGDSTIFTIHRPDGSVFDTWVLISDGNYTSSYWYFGAGTFPGSAPVGKWNIQLEYRQQVVIHQFTVNKVGTEMPQDVDLVAPPDNSIVRSDTTVLLAWQPAVAGELYTFQVCSNSQFLDSVLEIQTSATDIPIHVANGVHYWRVRGDIGANIGQWSPTWSFDKRTATGVPVVSAVAKTLLSIRPNPANDHVRIAFASANTSRQLTVFDRLGREVDRYVIAESSRSLDLSTKDYAAGVYTVRLGTSAAQIVVHR